jgi:hypothetical protein
MRINEIPITAIIVPVTTGGKNRSSELTKGGDDKAEYPCYDNRSVNSAQAEIGIVRHGQHRRDRGEGHAHHHRQANSKWADADRLNERYDPAGK